MISRKNKLGIGVLGCANIAKRLFIPAILSLKDEFQLVGIASRTIDKANEFANLFQITPIVGYENLLDRSDIDVVYIPLPTGLHDEWIRKALDSGKHVIAEKPFVLSYESAQEIVFLAKSKKLILIEDFMFRYHSQQQVVWRMILNNEFGSFRLFRSQFGFPPLNVDNFRYNMELGGGSLLDAGSYTINASLWFLGNDQEVISSTLYIDKHRNIDIFGNATLINKDGIVSQLSFGFDNSYQCNYEIWGSKGNIILPKAFTPKPTEITQIIVDHGNNIDRIEILPDNHFVNLLKDVHRKILLSDYQSSYEDILSQSRIMSDVKNKAILIEL